MAELVDKSLFQGLEPLVQERLFAPCCLSREQLWNDAVDWSGDQIDRIVVKPALSRLAAVRGEDVRNMVRQVDFDSKRDLIQNTLLEGDRFAVDFLAWYLEGRPDNVSCETEHKNNTAEPDLTVAHRGAHACNVELKRVVSTSNLRNYAAEFTEKSWQANHPSVLLFVFPLLSVGSWRAKTLAQGYVDFCETIDEWHSESMNAYVVTAPLEPADDTGDLPLRRVSQFVDETI